MKLEPVRIPSGKVKLAGLRYLPEQNVRPVALLYAHGFTSGKYSLDTLAGYFAGKGYEGLTFDFVGHKLGASGGEMQSATDACVNLRDALHWLRQQSKARQIVLIGHSMGGAATLAVAALEAARKPASHYEAALAGIVCLCIGEKPSQGFEGAIGQAMLQQRSDHVAGAPAAHLLGQLDSLVHAADNVGSLPALFIAARQDVLIAPERVEALARRVGPQAHMEVIESSHLEAPDRSRAAIAQWLAARGLC